jgi:hypothetical protein
MTNDGKATGGKCLSRPALNRCLASLSVLSQHRRGASVTSRGRIRRPERAIGSCVQSCAIPHVAEQEQKLLVGHGSVFDASQHVEERRQDLRPVPDLGLGLPRTAEQRLIRQRLTLGTEQSSVLEPVVGGCAAGIEYDRPAAYAAELLERSRCPTYTQAARFVQPAAVRWHVCDQGGQGSSAQACHATRPGGICLAARSHHFPGRDHMPVHRLVLRSEAHQVQ